MFINTVIYTVNLWLYWMIAVMTVASYKYTVEVINGV